MAKAMKGQRNRNFTVPSRSEQGSSRGKRKGRKNPALTN
jgi:hypothetical protein